MTPETRRLEVWLDDARIGDLAEAGNLWSFTYAPAWRGFDLAPALPRAEGRIEDGGSRRPVQWFFDNLLPEEGALTLLARDAGIDAADAFGLLAHYGPESAGALTLLAPGSTLAGGDLVPLTDAALSARIRALPRAPLSHDAPKRMSMAGAQHKLAVVLDGDDLFEPSGRTASTHVLKPDHERVEVYPHTVVNEWFCMSLAHAAGLPVPEVAVRRVPEPVYLVRRFDRVGEAVHARRLHVLDACQLLSLDRVYKYREARVDTLARIAVACRRDAMTRLALWRWSVFNLLVGNGDAHLKNLSLFIDDDDVRLAPHYDLFSTSVYREASRWGDAELVTPIARATTFGAVTRVEAIGFAEALGIPARVAIRQLDALLARIRHEAPRRLEAYEQGATGAVEPGEARLLRQILHGPLRDMLEALR